MGRNVNLIHMNKLSFPIPELLTIRQVARLMQVHHNTLRNWDNSGILKAVRIGKRGDRRYRKQDVLGFIEKRFDNKTEKKAPKRLFSVPWETLGI